MGNAMMDGALVGAVVGGVVMIVALVIAYRRRGAVATTRIGARRRELQTAAGPDAAFAAIAAIARPFRVDDADPARRALVLSTNPTLASWGFLFPIVITPRADGGATILIGIQSKLVQWGPIVTRWHGKCLAAIEAQLALPVARVVQR